MKAICNRTELRRCVAFGLWSALSLLMSLSLLKPSGHAVQARESSRASLAQAQGTGDLGYLYVLSSNPSGNEVYIYRANEASGNLVLVDRVATGQPGSLFFINHELAIDPVHRRLFAKNFTIGGANSISVYSINPVNGGLTELPYSPINLGDPSLGAWQSIAVHPSGSPVVVGDIDRTSNAGKLVSFNITATSGSLAGSFSMNSRARDIAFSKDGNYIYAMGDNNFSGFIVNPTTGNLTPLANSPYGFIPRGQPQSDGAGSFVTDSAGRIFLGSFVGLATDDLGYVHTFTTSNGIPTEVPSSPEPAGVYFPAFSLLHPNGFYLVGDRQGGQVGVYKINGSGAGTTLGAVAGSPFKTNVPFQRSAMMLALSGNGQQLWAVNQGASNITRFDVDPATGALSQPVTGSSISGVPYGVAYLPGTCPDIAVQPSVLPAAQIGVAYDQEISATVSDPAFPYGMKLLSGELPPGLTFDANSITRRLYGTPTTLGTFHFTIQAFVGYGCEEARDYTVTVGCPTITVTPAMLPAGVLGQTYSQTLSGTGGSSAFALTAGSLPPGLVLSATGALTGTPTQLGSYNFTVTATGDFGCTGARSYTINITCPSIALPDLAAGTAGTAYSQSLLTTPASFSYSYAVTSGLLPPGLTLSSGGQLSGMPTQSGSYNFRVTATGFGGQCATFRDYALTITCVAITLNPASLPGGTVGVAYNQTIGASPSGSSFAVTSGALPNGLTLNAGSGALSGIPIQSGTFSFRIAASNGSCSGSRDYGLVISCSGVTLGALPNGVTNTSYNQTISVTPAGAYIFSVTQGNLPSGVVLNANTGSLSGVPNMPGTYGFTIRAAGAGGCAGLQNYALTISCPIIALSDLPAPGLNTPYSQIVVASPAGGNYSFTITAGALPIGLSLNAATGMVNGTPATAGSYSFTITATGFSSCTGTRSYTGTIVAAACPTITLPTIPAGTVGQVYIQSVAASPSGSYSYTLTGTLPPGLTWYGAFGLLYGYPTQAGTYNFTITATDSNNCTGNRQYNLTIQGASQ